MSYLSFRRMWGDASALLYRTRQIPGIDLLLLFALLGIVFGLIRLGREWAAPREAPVDIDLSPWKLPLYTFFSLSRGILAYLLSLTFTLVYGYWAAKDQVAERVLVPMLDILQSIPVLGFMPIFFLTLVTLLPLSFGKEVVCILMIFTGQAWNMTFSFYHSLRALPLDQREVATVYRFTWWERFKWVELPYATTGLVWNSMMSMAGGWFFLAICEAFQLGERDFRVPGLGSYMSQAVKEWDIPAMLWAVVATALMIILLDQLVWNPIVVWAEKFRIEEGGFAEKGTSWFLDWLRHSRLLRLAGRWLRRPETEEGKPRPTEPVKTTFDPTRPTPGIVLVSRLIFAVLVGALVIGMVCLGWMLLQVPLQQWGELLLAGLLTLGRVILVVAVGTLWTLPAGLVIGLSPRLRGPLQPVIQFLASFPASVLFPLVVYVVVQRAGVPLDWGSMVLMLLGTQWYILFNVVAGSSAIPADLREVATSYRLSDWQRFRTLYLPAIFPYLVTGWVTAAGGAWNTSIVAEYVTIKDDVKQAHGLGAIISDAVASNDLHLLAASVLVMALIVVLFNRVVWKRCYDLAQTRFSLNK